MGETDSEVGLSPWHVLPRLVLRLAPRLVGAQRLGAADLELVVVALVPHDLLVAREVEDVADHAVEEGARLSAGMSRRCLGGV